MDLIKAFRLHLHHQGVLHSKDLKQEARCIPEQMSSSYSCDALSPEAIPGLIDSLDSLIDTLK